jgi:uncharacterized protein (UPF0261 family)
MATIAVLGTLDTNGDVHRYLSECIRARGHRVVMVDVGMLGNPQCQPDITRQDLLERTGFEESCLDTGREHAALVMGRSAGILLNRMFLEGSVDAVISAGGVCGAGIALSAMRSLPVGIPTVLVSHLAPEWVEEKAGLKDVLLVGSPVEVDNLNRIVRPILSRAAGMLCGAVEFGLSFAVSSDPPLVVASRFGPSDLGYERASRFIEEAGYEVVAFSEKGVGGSLMDSAVGGGEVSGVLDLSLTDLADEVVGGALGCGSRRMEATAKRAVPAVVAPGGVDTVFFNLDAVPREFSGRQLLERGSHVWMRTSPAECRKMGVVLAEKLNRFVGPVTVCLPLRGMSALGSPGEVFHDPAADLAFFETLQAHLRDGVQVRKVQTTSEEAPFAELCARALLENIGRRERELRMLRQIGFLRGASELILSEASRFLELRTYGEGEWVCRPGAAVDVVCIVSQGFLEVVDQGARLQKLGEGAVFGEDQFLTAGVWPYGIRALDACQLLRLKRSVVNQLLRRHPVLGLISAAPKSSSRSLNFERGPTRPGCDVE